MSSNKVYQEEEIVALLVVKDKKAIEILYQQYSHALYGVVLRIVLTEELANDVMQEAFVKVWRYADQYERSKGSLFTWLLNIFRNTAIDTTRSKQFKASRKISGDENVVVNIEDNGRATRPELIGIRELTHQLKPEVRLLIDKVYFEGYTQKEVAEELDIPLGTVKTRIRSAMKTLRTILQKDEVK